MMAQQPLESYRPPTVTPDVDKLFRAVYGALNDIDRSMYPPLETLRERRDQLIAAYVEVGERFKADANLCGLSDWLEYTITQRRFGTFFDAPIPEMRQMYEAMQRLGHPSVNDIISLPMIWANRLAEEGEADEARMVARQLLADLEEMRKRGIFFSIEEKDLTEFRTRHQI